MKKPSYKKLFELACEELGNWTNCPKDKDLDDCEKIDCTSCWQRYLEEKIDENN